MKNTLYVYPESLTYAEGDEAALAAKLTDMDRVTQTPYVSALAQIQLDHEGRLPGGYRYTLTAFKQICGLACPGLHQAVVDLSGIRRTSVQPRYDYSFADAVEVFNKALRIRYQERFDSKIRLIKDVNRHLVEGVMGPKYNYLENRALYDLARDAVASSPVRVRFLEAVLEGRRLLFRFIHDRPLFVLATNPGAEGERFSGGYHISNSEIGGEASVRVTTLLHRHRASTTSLGPFPGRGPLAHIGKDFAKKLAKVFSSALTAHQDGLLLSRRMQRLMESPLELGQEEKQREERLDDLSLLLHRQNIPRGLARRIVLATMSYGSEPARQLPRAPDRPQGRTWFDLYSTLTRESRGLDMTVMEAVEQAAFQILLGKVRDKRVT